MNGAKSAGLYPETTKRPPDCSISNANVPDSEPPSPGRRLLGNAEGTPFPCATAPSSRMEEYADPRPGAWLPACCTAVPEATTTTETHKSITGPKEGTQKTKHTGHLFGSRRRRPYVPGLGHLFTTDPPEHRTSYATPLCSRAREASCRPTSRRSYRNIVRIIAITSAACAPGTPTNDAHPTHHRASSSPGGPRTGKHTRE